MQPGFRIPKGKRKKSRRNGGFQMGNGERKRKLAVQGGRIWEIIDDEDVTPQVQGTRELVGCRRLFLARCRRMLTPPVIFAILLAKAIIILLLLSRE
jgi:hypothetical protein